MATSVASYALHTPLLDERKARPKARFVLTAVHFFLYELFISFHLICYLHQQTFKAQSDTSKTLMVME
jgi:hypothetical protein